MDRVRHITVLLVAVAFAACGGSADDGSEGAGGDAGGEEGSTVEAARGSGAPVVEDAFQDRIDEAWQEAVEGENPAYTCAGVKGRAATSERGSATRALAACNVDIPARYFLTYLDRVEAGEKTCRDLMMEIMTKLPSMTISTEGFRELAERGEGADTSDAAAVDAGAAILAGEAAAGGGVDDPEQMVKDRLREPVTAVCPDEASIIVR